MERQRLLLFYKSNAIAKAVQEVSVEGIKIDRKTVAKYCKPFKRDHPLRDSCSCRPPTMERRHFDFINQKLEQNDELILMPMFAIC